MKTDLAHDMIEIQIDRYGSGYTEEHARVIGTTVKTGLYHYEALTCVCGYYGYSIYNGYDGNY